VHGQGARRRSGSAEGRLAIAAISRAEQRETAPCSALSEVSDRHRSPNPAGRSCRRTSGFRQGTDPSCFSRGTRSAEDRFQIMEGRPDGARGTEDAAQQQRKTARNPDDPADRGPRRAAISAFTTEAQREESTPPHHRRRPRVLGRRLWARRRTFCNVSRTIAPGGFRTAKRKVGSDIRAETCQPHNPRAGSAKPSPLSGSTYVVSPRSCRPQAAFLAMLARPEFLLV